MTDRCLAYMSWDRRVYVEYHIPPHLHEGLDRYLKDHIRPGSYLFAVLTCDAKDAVFFFAGPDHKNPIAGLIRFFCAEIPSNAWGSVSVVEEWIAVGTFAPKHL